MLDGAATTLGYDPDGNRLIGMTWLFEHLRYRPTVDPSDRYTRQEPSSRSAIRAATFL